jgi:hypothetical protein
MGDARNTKIMTVIFRVTGTFIVVRSTYALIFQPIV